MPRSMSKPKKKMGRPEVVIDEAQLRGLLRLKPTLRDCAAFFKCSEDTIEKECRKYGAKTFSDFRDQNMVHTRFSLIRDAIRKAEHSDTMHIFCLKNLCGWADKFAEGSMDKNGDLVDQGSNKIEIKLMNPKNLSPEDLKIEVAKHFDLPPYQGDVSEKEVS